MYFINSVDSWPLPPGFDAWVHITPETNNCLWYDLKPMNIHNINYIIIESICYGMF